MESLGAAAGYLAVLVLALYVNTETSRALYGQPLAIWLICPALLYWISRVWLVTHRGEMHDDPILFALTDRNSRYTIPVSYTHLDVYKRQGEDHITEFKSGRFHNESLAKEMVAFANSNGGSIFIGIEDDGVVTGIDDKTVEERVINICCNLIEPSILPEIFYHQHSSGKKILEVVIPKGCLLYTSRCV